MWGSFCLPTSLNRSFFLHSGCIANKALTHGLFYLKKRTKDEAVIEHSLERLLKKTFIFSNLSRKSITVLCHGVNCV